MQGEMGPLEAGRDRRWRLRWQEAEAIEQQPSGRLVVVHGGRCVMLTAFEDDAAEVVTVELLEQGPLKM